MALINEVLQFFFPSCCVHCQESVPGAHDLLCRICLEQLVLTEIEGRCLACFAEEGAPLCAQCKETPKEFHRLAAAFEYQGPAKSLLTQFKFGGRPYLAKLLSSYMLVQYSKLDWPLPDLIIPVPQTFLRRARRGYNQSALLASEIGKLLHAEVAEPLVKKSGSLPQRGLDRKQRKEMIAESFKYKKGCSIQDKTLLLIDDVATTGATLNACASVLRENFAARVYALSCCIA